MEKSPGMRPEKGDLLLRWSGEANPSRNTVNRKNDTAPGRVEEYLDFLEEIGPVAQDDTPVKLYTEVFELLRREVYNGCRARGT